MRLPSRKQLSQVYRDRLHQSSSVSFVLRWWHVVSAMMIAIGGLAPFTPPFSSITVMMRLGHPLFIVWCLAMVIGGVAIARFPRYLPVFIAPLYIQFIGGYGALALESRTVDGLYSMTGLVYHSAVLVVILQQWVASFAPGYIERRRVKRHQVHAIGFLLMAIALVTYPDSQSMGLLYDSLAWFIGWLVEPHIAYQIIYIVVAILLIFPVTYKPNTLLFLYMPFIIHGFTFGVASALLFPAYSLTPIFLGVTTLWVLESRYA